jgi:hypothetical protein
MLKYKGPSFLFIGCTAHGLDNTLAAHESTGIHENAPGHYDGMLCPIRVRIRSTRPIRFAFQFLWGKGSEK